jgi:hypothetical protein
MRYTYDDGFFSDPSNPLACYWAGFIAADGCIDHKGQDSIALHLHVRDYDHLVRLTRDIQFTGPIARKACGRRISLRFHHAQRMVDDLGYLFNVTSRKSLTLQPPVITGPSALAFVAGYLDGDGWVTRHSAGVTVGVLGTWNMVAWIREHLAEQVHPTIGAYSLTRRRCAGEIYQMQVRNTNARRVAACLRTMDIPLLERKWSHL